MHDHKNTLCSPDCLKTERSEGNTDFSFCFLLSVSFITFVFYNLSG